jgi:hypothetical protein
MVMSRTLEYWKEFVNLDDEFYHSHSRTNLTENLRLKYELFFLLKICSSFASTNCSNIID